MRTMLLKRYRLLRESILKGHAPLRRTPEELFPRQDRIVLVITRLMPSPRSIGSPVLLSTPPCSRSLVSSLLLPHPSKPLDPLRRLPKRGSDWTGVAA